MARVLIGWELGSGLGHALSMRRMGLAIMARGHQVAFALQHVEALPGGVPKGSLLLQSPLWPRLLTLAEPGVPKPAVTLIDILARLGMDMPGCLTAMIGAWDGIMAGFKPDVVIADFAPALLIAAQGRVASIASGPGFQVPPDDMNPVICLGGETPGYDEATLLDLIDADLRDAGREPLSKLADLFRCNRRTIASFYELDPYRRPDSPDFIAPAIGSWAGPSDQQGDEVFVYANGPLQRYDGFWQGLIATGLPVRAHVPLRDQPLRDRIAGFGVMVERHPVPWPLIVSRSRIAVNHGAHGIMSGLMLAGIPQLALPLDLEKRLHGEALARAGFGMVADGHTIEKADVTATVQRLYHDVDMAERTRAAAYEFATRMKMPFETSIADAVDGLA